MCIRDRFYNSYGNSAVFKATNIYEGDIYFCSAGNTSTSGKKYRTIGYKMGVKNSSGNVIPVSYTHLDVYKRQAQGGMLAQLINIWGNSAI